MNSLVATKSSSIPFAGRFPAKLLAIAAALLALAGEVSAATDRSVTLAWNPNSEPGVAGYRLRYGTVSGQYPNTIDAGNATTATATGLNQGTSYYFVVVAYNSAGVTSAPSAEVSYTVPGTPNTAPSAASLAFEVPEDGQVAVSLSGSDPESDALSYTVVSAPGKGTLTGTGKDLVYRPAANVHGSDSFTYRVNDGLLDSPVATVSFTIAPANDAPVADPKTVTTNEDAAAAVVLSGSDVDGDSLTFSIVTAPTKGLLTGTPPNLTYQPASNLFGSDSFTYRVNDGSVNSAVATVSLNVTSVNDLPVANAATVNTNEDTPVSIILTGSDVEGSSLSYSIVTQPAKGTLSGSPPNLTYTPALNANGADSFSFRVNDGSANSPSATVSINVAAVNDVPVANAASVSTTVDTPVAVVLGGSDAEGSPLVFTVLSSPTKGVLGGTAPNLTYTPNSGVTGSDSFTFRVNDGTANSATATVSISVTPFNTVPVATPRSVTTNEDTSVPVVLAGTDADGNPLTFSVVTTPTKGVLSGTAPNLTYVPNANANGSDSFTFRVNDGIANSSPATVSISITAVNDAPVAHAKSVNTNKNTAVAIQLTGSDVEGSTLTFIPLTLPTKGVLTGIAPSFVYTPNTNATGSDSFTYRVNDGSANSASATVSINIANTNSAPQAVPQSIPTLKNKSVPIQLTATDPEGSPLTYRVINPPTFGGALSGTPPNLTFQPEKGFVGNTSFAFVANDGTADSPVAWISLKVKESNSKPAAVGKTVEANWNTGNPLVISGTDPDSDPLTFRVTKQPANGTLTGTPPNLTYVPGAGFKGNDSFAFVADDGLAASAVATVSIRVVNPSNRAPSSAPWAVSTPMKTAVPVTLRATDADGDTLSYRIVSRPANGKLSGKMPNLVFKPKSKFVGTASFTYIANDGSVDSAPITVTINVTQPPETTTRGLAVKAKAGTVPDELPRMSLATDPARPGVIVLSIAGSPGSSYQLEHSTDLNVWSAEREVVIGDEGTLELEVIAPAGAARGFFRLNAP